MFDGWMHVYGLVIVFLLVLIAWFTGYCAYGKSEGMMDALEMVNSGPTMRRAGTVLSHTGSESFLGYREPPAYFAGSDIPEIRKQQQKALMKERKQLGMSEAFVPSTNPSIRRYETMDSRFNQDRLASRLLARQ